MIFNNSNFSQQTSWVMVLITIFMASYYGFGVTQLEGDFATNAEGIVWLWIETSIVSVTLSVSVFIILTLINKKNNRDEEAYIVDERDELIESKATYWAYLNLHTCIIVLLIHVFCKAVIDGYPFFSDVAAIDFLIHGLFFTVLFVEFVLSLMKIYRY
jgi:hypothetical protein